MKLESNSTIERRNAGEVVSYPIPSLPGAGAQQNQRGWITRKLESDHMLIHLAPIDAMNGGAAVRLDAICHDFGLMDRRFYDNMKTVLEETIIERDVKIMELERQIGRLNDKIARVKKYAKR